MTLTPRQEKFLFRRRSVVRYSSVLILFFSTGYIAFLAWAYAGQSLFFSPWEVLKRIRNHTLEPSTAYTMAAVLPILAIMMCLVLGAVVVFAMALLTIEKKYLAMIDRLHDEP